MPNNDPRTIASRIAQQAFTPQSIIFAISMPVKAMTEPTDKSMPPERITTIAPMDATPRYALSCNRFRKTRKEPKLRKLAMPMAYASRNTRIVAPIGTKRTGICGFFMRRLLSPCG